MLTMEHEVEVARAPEPAHPAAPSKWVQYARAFAGLFLRDLHVLRREKISFLIRVCMNPLLFLFVFTYIMPHMSGGAALNPTAQMAGANFSTVLLPGLMAVAIMFSGIAAVALPLAQEFGITREIDDRVMCPLPVAAVAIEKIVFSAMQSMIAAAFVFPLAYYVPATPVYAHVNSWPFLIAVIALASLTAGALGLVIGTSVKPQQISLIFGTVVMPITFLGCVYYPWAMLDTHADTAACHPHQPHRLHERRPARRTHPHPAPHEPAARPDHAQLLARAAQLVRHPWLPPPRHRLSTEN